MLTSNQHQEPSGESRIDKMRKFLSSPLTRKKSSGLQVKTFGTPLDTLLQRTTSEHSVPFVVTRLCLYILRSGMTHEGLFRISGNARSVERLKASFDRTGDAPLETEGDVPTAAALLKLFLRELPDPIIPLDMHCQFLEAVKDKDKEESVARLTDLVEKLPPVNYSILNYLCSFLKKVSEMEEQNRMNASSLGIVFGPNLFRVTEDFVGLKEQSLTNQIVTYLITHHQEVFREDVAFQYTTCYASAINKTSQQVAAMVSSWPEGRGTSSSLLSTWSLGPITCTTDPTDDSYYSLKSISQSIMRTDTTDSGFTSLKLDDNASTSESDFRFCRKDISSDFPYCLTRNSSKDNNLSLTSSPREAKDRKSSISLGKESCLKEYYIMEEEPLLCHTPLTVRAPATTVDLSCNQEGNQSPSSKSLVHAFNNLSLQRDYLTDVQCASTNNSQHQSRISHEKSEEMMKDIHKSYPRGRRRHVRHHKSKSHGEERRSHSEMRPKHEPATNGDSVDGILSLTDKLDVQHASTGSLDESRTESRHSWPSFRKCNEEEDIALSPLPQQLEVNVCGEASISPSAFRSYLSHRNLHLDPSLPPSPPVEQEDLVVGASSDPETSSAHSKHLFRKVHALKKKIKMFEENFEKLYGYKPSHAEKCSNFTIRKIISEINKARNELKQLKEDPQLFNADESMPSTSSKGTNTRSSQGLFSPSDGNAENGSVEDTIKDSYAYMMRRRKIESRPDNLEEMNRNQLVQEKTALQRILLNFEDVHGRSAAKEHKELTRPLYDRYRNTKRLIARTDADLIPILENETTMDFKKSDQAECPEVTEENRYTEPAAHQSTVNGDAELETHINFHDLSLSELESEMNLVREEKRRLRKELKEFEEDFRRENDRKAQREDKRCMESYYTAYKNAKAKLKLLEALVAKYGQSSTI